jgi:hypothetical protein
MKKLALLLFLYSQSIWAQQQIPVLDVDLRDQCRDVLQKEQPTLVCDDIPPVVLDKLDEKNNPWKVRFHFGFSRTDYRPTDLHIQSSVANVVIRGVEMHERTSAHHYNPAHWGELKNSLKWIDEPTNTFTISLENNNNAFYLTIFHPKYLKSILYKKTVVDGQEQFEFSDIHESDNFSQVIPDGHGMMYLGNTHMNLVTQVGYGRKFKIVETEKFGKITFIPRADFGISTGKARSVHIIRGERWDDYNDDHTLQGFNVSLGSRLEYQKGKVSMFVDYKANYAKMKHAFYDGTVEYDLIMTPVTFGLGIDVFSGKKKKKK